MLGKRFQRFLFYLIGFLAYYFIIKRLLAFEHWNTFTHGLSFSNTQVYIGGVLIILLLANVFCEVKKWQVLIAPFYNVSLYNALLQYLAGTLTAVGSPARVAEPGGRMALLPRQHRLKALVMTSIGGFIQNLIILSFGFFALSLSSLSDFNFFVFNSNPFHPFLFVSISITAFGVIIYLFRNKLKFLLLQINRISYVVILKSLAWTIARYLIYTTQFYIWLLFFEVDLPLTTFLLYAPIYFLFITIIPSFLGMDLAIRGSASIVLFSNLGISIPLILSSVLGLWFLNVVIPAVIGAWVLYRKKGL